MEVLFMDFDVDAEGRMCRMSISLPVHTICTVCAVRVNKHQAHGFGVT